MTPVDESTPLVVASTNTSKEQSNFYFLERRDSSNTDTNNVTVANVLNSLGEDGEPSSEEIVNMLPKNTVSSEFASRPIFHSPKRRASDQPQPSPFQLFTKLFTNNKNNHKSSNDNSNNMSVKGNSGAAGTMMKPRKAPIKIDPKVFFANERTFLAWLHISVLLAGVSIAILALAEDQNIFSIIYGILLLPVAIAFIVYSMVQYMRRSAMIRRRDPGPYEDIVGPTILTIMLMGSIIIQFSIKLYHLSSKIR